MPTGTPAGAPVSNRIAYGDDPAQFGFLDIPGGSDAAPVVVLIHGGFWRVQFGLDLMVPLAEDLVADGYAVWNIEYRRVGSSGGGWPGTLDDVAIALERLASVDVHDRLDLDRVAVVGHSAGGHLAAWVAGDAWGRDAEVKPIVAVPQAGVLDLVQAATAGIGNRAVQGLLGGEPDEVPDRYERATPVFVDEVTYTTVHGTADGNVPLEYGRLPDGVGTELIFDDMGHFEVIDPTHESWVAVKDALAQMQ